MWQLYTKFCCLPSRERDGVDDYDTVHEDGWTLRDQVSLGVTVKPHDVLFLAQRVEQTKRVSEIVLRTKISILNL